MNRSNNKSLTADDIEVDLCHRDINWTVKEPYELSILVFDKKEIAEALKQQILDNQEIVQYFKNKFPYQYHQAKLDLENKIC